LGKSTNTFSDDSPSYANARPKYPKALFAWISEQCNAYDRAWDCATGNGQAAIDLAEYFTRVDATDISEQQLEHALTHPRVFYSIAPAETSGLPEHVFDLVAVAQALHWFDHVAFWSEVRQVAKRGAFFCAWGYDWLESPRRIDEEFVAPFCALLRPFWASNNQILWNGYSASELAFPFDPIESPTFAINVNWSTEQLINYMMTWSAYKRSGADMNTSKAIDRLVQHVHAMVPEDNVLDIRMPLKIIAGRIS
jgi:hypothetical protein